MAFSAANLGILTYDYPADELVPLTRTMEELGFGAFWFGEHYVAPKHFQSGHTTGGEDRVAIARGIIFDDVRIHDPFFVLGAVAGATTKLRFGTSITIIPLNHPLHLARSTMTAAEVSGGRFMLGTGIGWLEEEYAAFGVPFKQRASRPEETIDILRKAWAGGYFVHSGRHWQFDELQITHHPANVPLIMGGNTEVALERAARLGDGWLNSAKISLADALRCRDRLEALRKELGTAGRPFSYHVRPQEPDPDLIGQFVAEGFENIVLWGPSVWPNRTEMSIADKAMGLRRYAESLGVA